MQYQSEIATISRVAPPTYAEAVAQAATMKASAPPQTPPTGDHPYEQHPQVPSYTSVILGSQAQSTGNTSITSPRIDNPYVGNSSIQQSPAPPCVVRVDRMVYKTRWKDRCCSPKVTAGLFTFFLLMVMVKLLVSAS